MNRLVIAAAVLTLTASCEATPAPLEHASLDFTTTDQGSAIIFIDADSAAAALGADPVPGSGR